MFFANATLRSRRAEKVYVDVSACRPPKKADPDAEKTYKAVASRVGMGRWGRVEEIAHPCVFLASDASSWMTGETIVVDGGPPPQTLEG